MPDPGEGRASGEGHQWRLALITGFTLIAFAANSLLCRRALGGELIDPVSFTSIRLGSGALTLLLLASRVREGGSRAGSWGSAAALFGYAIAFSLAYVSLTTGTGALILFGSVQLTMLLWAMREGDRLDPLQGVGLVLALGGLTYLVFPGLAAPDPLGAALMVTAGVAWGIYSIRGRGAPAPIRMTAGNFTRTLPFVLAASVIGFAALRISTAGVALAVLSGSVTSGLGYVLWYRALRSLTTVRAAIVQLLVPVLAALAGVALLAEALTARLVIASILVLGGVGLAVLRRARPSRRRAIGA